MRIRSCADCGKVLPDEALFCGQCGKAQAALPPQTARNTASPPPLASSLASTMVRPSTVPDPKAQDDLLEATAATGQPSPELLHKAKPSDSAIATAPKYDPTKTILDIGPPPSLLAEHAPPTPALPTPPLPLGSASPPAANPPAAAAAPPVRAIGSRTVVGFAPPSPGLSAPSAPVVSPEAQMEALAATLASNQHVSPVSPLVPAVPPSPPVWQAPSKHKTMLGGVAPAVSPNSPGGTLPSTTPAVHAPVEHNLPDVVTNVDNDEHVEPAPRSQRISSAIVIVCAVLFVACIAAIALFVRARRPGVSARAAVDESGTEVLRVRCPGCPDGATVSIGSSSAKVTSEVAQLRLAEPLQIGTNRFSVSVEGRTPGRTETTSIPIVLPYRVRADFSTVRLVPSVITVRVEAEPGTVATVASTPVALDVTGHGSAAIDVSADTRVQSAELSLLERTVPYSIKVLGEPEEKGTLLARAKLLPLTLSTPIDGQLVATESFVLAGRTLPGATISIDGHAATVDANGVFGVNVKAAALGERSLDIVSSQEGFAARSVRVTVQRIADLTESAKAMEAGSPLTYRAFSGAGPQLFGKTVVAEGDVVESRVEAHRTILVLSERRDCPRGTKCLTRIVYGSEEPLKVGERLRAFGRLVGTSPRDGVAIPDVQALLVIRTKP